MKLEKATRPTMYFIGVTTGSSSIMKVFPEWVKELGIDTEIKGIDIAIHEKPEVYREVVDFIKHDPLSLGALVTTHKIDIYAAAHDMFDGAVFSGGVHGLENQDEGLFTFGVEFILKRGDFLAVCLSFIPDFVLVQAQPLGTGRKSVQLQLFVSVETEFF